MPFCAVAAGGRGQETRQGMDAQRIEPLSPDRHGARYWRRPQSYGFARGLRRVPLALIELEPVAAAIPVLFAGGPQGLEPVALLRLSPGGDSRFISPRGLWLAAYVPSALRAHPFSARPAQDGRMMLMVDEASGLVTDDPGDERFFAADGQLTPATAAVVEFFRQREGSAGRARAAVARLAELGLLCPFLPQAPAVPAEVWRGLWAVNTARFAALDDARFLELRRLGALGLVHAHLVSMTQVQWLLRAEALADEEAAGLRAPIVRALPAAAPEPEPTAAGVRDFLAALAAAETAAAHG